MKENNHVLLKQFHGNGPSKSINCGKMMLNASWRLKELRCSRGLFKIHRVAIYIAVDYLICVAGFQIQRRPDGLP